MFLKMMRWWVLIAALMGMAGIAGARPFYLELDDRAAGQKPSDFGIAVSAREEGEYVTVTLRLNAEASAAMKGVKVLILGDLKKEEIPKVTESEAPEGKVIEVKCLTRALADYAVRIESFGSDKTPKLNFSGYTLQLKWFKPGWEEAKDGAG